MMRHKNTKLTEEKIQLASKLIGAGNTVKTIYGALGVSKQTWYNWLDKGSKAKSGLYRKLYEEVEKAESRAESRYVTIIAQAAEENWQAAAWMLERKYPERWGRKDKVDLSADKDGFKVVVEYIDKGKQDGNES